MACGCGDPVKELCELSCAEPWVTARARSLWGAQTVLQAPCSAAGRGEAQGCASRPFSAPAEPQGHWGAGADPEQLSAGRTAVCCDAGSVSPEPSSCLFRSVPGSLGARFLGWGEPGGWTSLAGRGTTPAVTAPL